MPPPLANRAPFAGFLLLACASLAFAAPATPPDLTKPTLYLVGYAHLDTQWRWTYPQVVREFIVNTMHDNFPLFEKYPDYIFNFTGARRYQFMKEYYPADFAKVQQYVKEGRWYPCGSTVDECDVDVPSGESLVRQILYGNEFFRANFGMESHDLMLPDTFGFTQALPTIMAHCGLRGFSTQKLSWGSAVGIPFKVGVWIGPDGRSVLAAFDPGSYTGDVNGDLSHSDAFLKRINDTGQLSGVYVDYHYYGVGDRGGAPKERSAKSVEQSVSGGGPIHVVSARADQMFVDITDAQKARLPTYKGELLLTWHSAGSITSQSAMKRWNRKNELLADDAERASVAADWLGAAAYPMDRLRNAWFILLGSQMHDMMAGTARPDAYNFIWNDEMLVANQFASVTSDAVEATTQWLDTRGQGVCIVVYNPLSFERQDIAQAEVQYPSPQAVPQDIRVVGPDGQPVPSQILERKESSLKICFLARVPSVGFATFDVRPAEPGAAPGLAGEALTVTGHSLENDRLRVTLDNNGDIASIFDKLNDREVLASPAQLAFLHERPRQYPAWNMDWEDRQHPPRAYVTGPATVRIVESGPARAALEVTRLSQGSKFVQTISLAAGDAGDRVEVANQIDWDTPGSSLKASFPFTIGNPQADYDSQVGVVRRGNNDPKKFEVPQHQWFDLTEPSGDFGVSILNDCKYGSDKPDDHTMRLTLLYTPGTRGNYEDQATQDFGHHEMTYAIAPHAGDWRSGETPGKAARLNQPLLTFETPSHRGQGRTFSFLWLDTPQVAITAVKKSEDGSGIVVRLRELDGKPAPGVRLAAAASIASAQEVDGQEKPLGPARIDNGAVTIDLNPFALRAVEIKLASPTSVMAGMTGGAADLPYDLDAVSFMANPADGSFDDQGQTYPAELWPTDLTVDGVPFHLGSSADGQKNALICHGQTIQMPAVNHDQRVYILASAIGGDQKVQFKVGDRATDCDVQDWSSNIGAWDRRIWKNPIPEVDYAFHNVYNGLVPGFVKPAEVAWFSNHRHNASGNEFYQYCYLFKFILNVPADGASTLTLPDNPHVRIFAVSSATGIHDSTHPAMALFDRMEGRSSQGPTISPSGGKFDDTVAVTVDHPLYWNGAALRYTLDGTDPTLDSPAYDGPIDISAPATLKVAMLDESGRPTQMAAAQFDVHDVTPPKIVSVSGAQGVPLATVVFSKRLAADSAEKPGAFIFSPVDPVKSATLEHDGSSVNLVLDHPLDAGATLEIHGVRDRSPAGNPVAAEPVTAFVASPVFELKDAITSPRVTNVPGLPVKGTDPWTLNFFCQPSGQPADRTVIAGFGKADGKDDGTSRYLTKFKNGLHFWGCDVDVDSTTPLDPDQWQMLTATFDGQKIRIFKNGKLAAEQATILSDDESIVRIFPLEPWDNKRIFAGSIRDFSIWNAALPPDAITTLWKRDGAANP